MSKSGQGQTVRAIPGHIARIRTGVVMFPQRGLGNSLSTDSKPRPRGTIKLVNFIFLQEIT